jgi:hypothetical protein
MPVVLTAAELIASAAERGGSIEFARIATLRAINRNVQRAFEPSRKTRIGAACLQKYLYDHCLCEQLTLVQPQLSPLCASLVRLLFP